MGSHGYEVTLSPGDLLFIPPYYQHRVEASCRDVCLSLSVLSPSTIEAMLAQANWMPVPFGPYQTLAADRSRAVAIYLELLIHYMVSFDTSIRIISNKLYESRFMALYGIEHLDHKYRSSPHICGNGGGATLEGTVDAFKVTAISVANMFESLYSLDMIGDRSLVNHHIRAILETSLMDYIEQLARWAVGPSDVPLYIYKCLSDSYSH